MVESTRGVSSSGELLEGRLVSAVKVIIVSLKTSDEKADTTNKCQH